MEGEAFQSRRILVVDDLELTAKSIGRVLQARGAEVVVASSVPEALASIDASPSFDAAVVDFHLLDRQGHEVVTALRESDPPVCSLVITAVPREDVGRKVFAASAEGYLIKPFDLEEFLPALQRVLDRTDFWRRMLAARPAAQHPAEPFVVGRGRASGAAPGATREERWFAWAALSRREAEVARLVLQGLKNDDIAARLSMATRTVKFHASAVYRKLGVANRQELIRLLLSQEPPDDDAGDQGGS